MGCHFLLQRIFLIQGSNPRLLDLLYWQVDSLPLVPPGKPPITLITEEITRVLRALHQELGTKTKCLSYYTTLLGLSILQKKKKNLETSPYSLSLSGYFWLSFSVYWL